MSAGSPPVRLEYHRGIGILRVDSADGNRLTDAVCRSLAAALAAAQTDARVRRIAILGKGQRGLRDVALDVVPSTVLSDLCLRIEASTKPVIAVLSGNVRGRVFDLALACHCRIASDRASLGHKAMMLGLPPHAGATQRLPRLLGAGAALDLLLEAGDISANAALDLGLIDRISTGDLRHDTLAFGATLDQPRPTAERRAQFGDAARYMAQINARRDMAGTQVARRIVDCVEAALLMPIEAGLALERQAFMDCFDSSVSVALRHLARAETRLLAVSRSRQMPRINRVALVGGDPVIVDIAMACLNAGLAVTVLDHSEAALVATLERIGALYETATAEGRIADTAGTEALSRLSLTLRSEKLVDVDMILATGSEMPAVPGVPCARHMSIRGAAQSLDAAVTATSFHLHAGIAEISAQHGAPHSAVHALLARLGLIPVLQSGGLACAQLVAAMRFAMDDLRARGASPTRIAAALRAEGYDAPLYDLLGLPDATADRDPGPMAEVAPERLFLACVNQGAKLLEQGIVADAGDIDVLATRVLGFAGSRGGPMLLADQISPFEINRRLERQRHRDGDFWKPAPVLTRMARERQKFKDVAELLAEPGVPRL